MNIEDLKTEGEAYLGEGGAPPVVRNYQEPSAPSYEPIDTWEDLMSYGVTRKIVNGVEVEVETIPEVTLIEKTLPMSTAFSDVKIQVSGRRFRNKSCPRTLVCHDCKTIYKDDKYVLGTNNPESYYFRHWLQTDIFCYFAHRFVTIPPLGWINAAHKHGVQCIGTIITEPAEDGENICKELLRDRESMEKAVKKLCMVAQHYGFDGYLVNIENDINEDGPTEHGKKKAREMIQFVRLLHENIKFVNPNAVVIWYDALGLYGRLNYENELNEKNKPFFDVCDGIFLNYDWNEANLLKSVENAAGRELDVFVGVDVWKGSRAGRPPTDDGGVRTCEMVKMAADCGLSVAIFAPGWAFEKHFEEFPSVDNQLWMNCAKYFYFRTLKVSDANETEVDGGVVSAPQSGGYQVIFSTDFSLGLGQRKFRFGKEQETTGGGPWFNLNKQSFQPALNCFGSGKEHPIACANFERECGFLGGVSLSIPPIAQDEIQCFPLWIPLDVSLRENFRSDAGTKFAAIVLVAWQNKDLGELKINATGSNHPIKTFLELMQPSVSSREVICLSNVNEQIGFELPKKPVTIQLKRFITQSQLCNQDDPIPDVNLVFDNSPYAEEVVNGWKISGFMMGVNHCTDWNITALRLGAVTPVNVGLLSLALLSY